MFIVGKEVVGEEQVIAVRAETDRVTRCSYGAVPDRDERGVWPAGGWVLEIVQPDAVVLIAIGERVNETVIIGTEAVVENGQWADAEDHCISGSFPHFESEQAAASWKHLEFVKAIGRSEPIRIGRILNILRRFAFFGLDEESGQITAAIARLAIVTAAARGSGAGAAAAGTIGFIAAGRNIIVFLLVLF